MDQGIILQIQDLDVVLERRNREVSILNGITFTLERGKCLGIVGESGSGKTITALSILKLLPPGMRISGGSILYRSEKSGPVDLVSLDKNKIRKFRGKVAGMIFQEPMTSLNPSKSGGKQILESVKLHLNLRGKSAYKQVIRLLEEVSLPAEKSFYQKYPHQLSGGQRQRIMIAMALAGNPEILIADEPTTALDVTVQKEVLLLLKEIQISRNMSILFISHDLGVIRMMADRAIIMKEGDIVEQGPVKEIFKSPKHNYTKELLASRPNINSTQTHPRPSETDESGVPLLVVENISTDYVLKRNFFGKILKKLIAVNDISFSIYRGETLGLIGESGSGKSTLGRTLLRLIEASSGQILYRGRPLNELKGKQLKAFHKSIQVIFQDPYSSLNPKMRIGNAITEVMKVHGLYNNKGKREEAARELLIKVGLEPEHFNRYPHEFSGGQRQRIGIARALACSPELIICDEAVSALDVSVQARILKLLNSLRNEFGLTYIFISHDLAVVKYMSDRIMVMKDGRMVEAGYPEQVFHHPEHPYTKELIEALPG